MYCVLTCPLCHTFESGGRGGGYDRDAGLCVIKMLLMPFRILPGLYVQASVRGYLCIA